LWQIAANCAAKRRKTPQNAEKRRKTLQNAAIYRKTPQNAAKHCKTPQFAEKRRNSLQNVRPPLNKLVKWNMAIFPIPKNFHKFTLTHDDISAIRCNLPQFATICPKMLQNTAIRCKMLQNAAIHHKMPQFAPKRCKTPKNPAN